jgi:hypothetical protein
LLRDVAARRPDLIEVAPAALGLCLYNSRFGFSKIFDGHALAVVWVPRFREAVPVEVIQGVGVSLWNARQKEF